jgi:hypothetical protein
MLSDILYNVLDELFTDKERTHNILNNTIQ